MENKRIVDLIYYFPKELGWLVCLFRLRNSTNLLKYFCNNFIQFWTVITAVSSMCYVSMPCGWKLFCSITESRFLKKMPTLCWLKTEVRSKLVVSGVLMKSKGCFFMNEVNQSKLVNLFYFQDFVTFKLLEIARSNAVFRISLIRNKYLKWEACIFSVLLPVHT